MIGTDEPIPDNKRNIIPSIVPGIT